MCQVFFKIFNLPPSTSTRVHYWNMDTVSPRYEERQESEISQDVSLVVAILEEVLNSEVGLDIGAGVKIHS